MFPAGTVGRHINRKLRAPSRLQILSTYRSTLRAMDEALNPKGRAQIASPKAAAAGYEDSAGTFAPKTKWREIVQRHYRDNIGKTDKQEIAFLHTKGTEFLAYVSTNTSHFEKLKEAGWLSSTRKDEQIKGVANYVGLGLPDKTFKDKAVKPVEDATRGGVFIDERKK